MSLVPAPGRASCGRMVLPAARLAAAALAAIAVAGCGGEEEEGAAPPGSAGDASRAAEDSRPADRSGESGAAERRAGGGDGPARPGAAPDGSPSRGDCVFTAPPGRLAREEVAIELDGVPCREAVPLARAAALGQPAGANLTIRRDGFRCEPSTSMKGANVTYACTGPSGEVRFDVVWSEPGS